VAAAEWRELYGTRKTSVRHGKIWGLTLTLGGALMIAPAGAEVAAVAGAGARTCAEMQSDIAELPNVGRSYIAWMQGFLSAMNRAREARREPPIDLGDYEAEWRRVSGWCATRPEETVAAAAEAVFEELASQPAKE
jgi:hypothetical protein